MFAGPIRLGGRFPGGIRCAGKVVIYKGDPVTDENLFFDGYPFADKGVATNLAPGPDAGPFLDFDEGADAGLVADLATVEVHEGVDYYIPA
jgi:hypothetical protein